MSSRAAEGIDATPMRSSVHWALLGLIIEQPSYGYELSQRFERAYEGVLHISSPSYIYAALQVLHRRSLIEEVPGKGGARQPKPSYRATQEGMRAYQEQLISEVGEDHRRSRLFARKLAVFARTPDTALEVIARYRSACVEQAMRSPPSPTDEQAPLDTASGLSLRLEIEQARLATDAKLRWLDYASRELGALPRHRERRRVNSTG